jgi:Zn-dependent protease with chaperone function
MTFLLLVFLAGVCVFEHYPATLWGGPSWQAPLGTAVGLVLVALHAFAVAWQLRRQIRRDPAGLDRHLVRYDRARVVHGCVALTFYLIALAVLGWGHWVRNRGGGAGTEVLLLAPFLLSQILSWLAFFDADREVHRVTYPCLGSSALTPALEAHHPAPLPFAGRWAYVLFQLRQKLALVFIPLVLWVARQELVRLLPREWATGPLGTYGVTGVGLVAMLVGMPLLIRLVLGLQPLPPGPLRTRLEATARRLGFRLSNILVWNTRQGMANAMIIGLVPWMRYVVLTDRLLEEFSPEEVQAVFGHELGHLKHQHMLFYLLFLTLSISVLGLVTDSYVLPWLGLGGGWLAAAYPGWFPADLGEWFDPQGSFALVLVLVLLLLYVYVIFGFLSRWCERQADIYGCRAVSCGNPHCTGHHDETLYPPQGGLCSTGIRIFTRALDRVAFLNGIDRDRPGFFQSWQHSTIARRVQFLLRMMLDPRVEPAFQGRLAAIKWSLMGGLLTLLVALLVWTNG